MVDHIFDEFAYDVHTGPVTTVDDDISFATELRKLLSVVVLDVSLAARRAD
jgi:hypothetical protein